MLSLRACLINKTISTKLIADCQKWQSAERSKKVRIRLTNGRGMNESLNNMLNHKTTVMDVYDAAYDAKCEALIPVLNKEIPVQIQ